MLKREIFRIKKDRLRELEKFGYTYEAQRNLYSKVIETEQHNELKVLITSDCCIQYCVNGVIEELAFDNPYIQDLVENGMIIIEVRTLLVGDMTREQFSELDFIDEESETSVDSIVIIPREDDYGLFQVVACSRGQPIGKCQDEGIYSILLESALNMMSIDCLSNSGYMRITLPEKEYVIQPDMNRIVRKRRTVDG